jgi:hypothetical protein
LCSATGKPRELHSFFHPYIYMLTNWSYCLKNLPGGSSGI